MKDVLKELRDEYIEQINDFKKNGIKNQIPNLLTFSRALAPIIIIPTLLCGRLDIAVLELIVFAITDFLDGRIARKYNIVSSFGIKLDAICDKIFAIGLMIPAMIKWPILLINLMLELCISYINLVSELKNNHPRSNMIGKIKTTLLSITLILCYIPNIDKYLVLLSSIVTFGFQILAFLKYREIDIDKDTRKKRRRRKDNEKSSE